MASLRFLIIFFCLATVVNAPSIAQQSRAWSYDCDQKNMKKNKRSGHCYRLVGTTLYWFNPDNNWTSPAMPLTEKDGVKGWIFENGNFLSQKRLMSE